MEEANQSGGLRDFLTVLFKHKSKILLIFLTTVATVTLASFLLPPTYEAKSTLLVKFGREYIYRPEIGDKNLDIRSLIPMNQEELINSEIQILTSQDLIQRVINEIAVKNLYPDLDRNPPGKISPLDAATHRFGKDLSVEGIKRSNVIQVTFQHKEPTVAARAVNLLTEFLKEKHLQVYSDPKSSFLEQELQAFDQRLKESQRLLEEFKQKNRVFSLEEQRSLLLKQFTELDSASKNAENQIKELKRKVISLQEQMGRISEQVQLQSETERYKIIDDAKANLLSLQLKEQELAERYREDNRLVVNVRKEIRLVQDFIRKQEEELKGKVTTGKNVVYQEMEKDLIRSQAELSSRRASFASLKGQVAHVDQELRDLDLKENEFENLKREVSSNEKNYKTYLEKVEEARISENLNRQKMANISVVQVAAIPLKPVKPRKALNIILGIFLGGITGLGFAFFSEYASQGLSTPESAERKLGLPVLTTVPYRG